jgi:hypothetical protein
MPSERLFEDFMAEPTDVIVPILQRIQADIADSKRDLGSRLDSVTETLSHHSEKLEAIEGYLTYGLGLTARNSADIETLKSEIDDIRKRVDALERR